MIFIKDITKQNIIVIPGEPRGKGRPRFTKQGHVFTDLKTRNYEKLVGVEYKNQCGKKFKENVEIEIIAKYKIAKNDSKSTKEKKINGEIRPDKKPDIDNIVKAILDGLNGIAYDDDKQVVDVKASKFYSVEPKVIIMISKAS